MRPATEAHADREDSAGAPEIEFTRSYYHAPVQGGRGSSRADRPRTSQHRTWRRDEGAADEDSTRSVWIEKLGNGNFSVYPGLFYIYTHDPVLTLTLREFALCSPL